MSPTYVFVSISRSEARVEEVYERTELLKLRGVRTSCFSAATINRSVYFVDTTFLSHSHLSLIHCAAARFSASLKPLRTTIPTSLYVLKGKNRHSLDKATHWQLNFFLKADSLRGWEALRTVARKPSQSFNLISVMHRRSTSMQSILSIPFSTRTTR